MSTVTATISSSTVSSHAEQEDSQSILERVRLRLNKILASKLVKTFEQTPETDFERAVEDVLNEYHRRLDKARQAAKERKAVFSDVSNIQRSTQMIPPPEGHDSALSAVAVVYALAPSLRTRLGMCAMHNADDAALVKSSLAQAIRDGKCLFRGPSRTVVQLTDEIVVKFGRTVSRNEACLLEYVKHQSTIPVPQHLGFVDIGTQSYIFTTFAPGETLETRWTHLTQAQKASVCRQLNDMLAELRRIPCPASTPLGTLSSPHVCMDLRMTLNVSSPDIMTVSEFHDFLLSRPFPGVSSTYLRWLRSLLPDDYRVTLTHGDFHPRNIMVVEEPAGDVRISAIIDWEMGGWYPEYWELYKAFNTRGGDDESDWWDSLPEVIRGYDREVVTRRLIEQSIRN